MLEENKGNILKLNANFKYIEFILNEFDNGDDKKTLREIRKEFKCKFKHSDNMLNQYFGIARLMPLILIKEELKNEKKEIKGDIETIKIIRDSVVHNDFTINEEGYIFKNNREEVKFNFKDFMSFLYEIENNFYTSDPDGSNNA